ncbi:hypothetical protein DMH04_33895 [Kibdelosporangium aridum]|uniref:Uncharacterized protein n=1 Tax=Kibdelosporangium aridum TaxID=2030 RepID=A0A428Z0W8_KIBAR|nr:hypothetical protein DMH04_33895 [Kibdelosporangium aridum]
MVIGAIAITTTLAITSPAASVPTAPKSAIPGTSKFLAFPGPEFSGEPQVISSCHSHDIIHHGSYQWYGYGQDGQMFERGRHVWTLNSDQFTRQATPFGWDRIYIIC